MTGRALGLTLPSAGRTLCVLVERLCRLTMVSAIERFSETVANDANYDLDRRLSVFKFLWL